ncbi:MAG: acyl-CoA dehydrogenase family protein [Myxococcota bacterium]
MISFQLTEEQQVVRDSLHEFAEQVLRPLARECDEASEIPNDFLDQTWELGLVSTAIPEAFGGAGEPHSPITQALIAEELAWGDATLATAALAPLAFVNALLTQGTEAQQAELLPLFCGERFHAASLAWIEPGPAFEPLLPRTLAEPKGDGFVLSGAKSFVPFGDRASHFLVVCRNNGGHDAFIVPRDAGGLQISETEKNVGLRALPTHTLELERVEVPASARLGGEQGFDLKRLLNHSRVALAAQLAGIARAVVEYAVPYAKEREAFDQAIAQKQGIAFKLADMHIETEAMRWLTWKAASQLEQGLDALAGAHHARAYASEKAMWVSDEGIQVLGGHGFIREHPVEMWYRNARTLGVLEGTVSV